MERIAEYLNERLNDGKISFADARNILYVHDCFDHVPTAREALDFLDPSLNDLYEILRKEVSTVGIFLDRELDGTIIYIDDAMTAVAPCEEDLEYLNEFYSSARLANETERQVLCSDDVESIYIRLV